MSDNNTRVDPKELFEQVTEGDQIVWDGREEPLTVFRHVTEDDHPGQAITMKRVTEQMARDSAWEVENGHHANDALEAGDLMTGEHTGDEFLIARGPRGGCYLLKQWWDKNPRGEWTADIALFRCTMADSEVWSWENTVDVKISGSEDVDRDAFDEGGDWVHHDDVAGATVWANRLDGDVWEHSEALTGTVPADPSEDPRVAAMDALATVSEGDTVQVNDLDAGTVTDVTDNTDSVLADGLSITLDVDGREIQVRTFTEKGEAHWRSEDGEDGEVTDVCVGEDVEEAETDGGQRVMADGGVAIEVGGEYDAMGERVEVTNEKDDKLCVHHPEREPVEGTAYTVWRPRKSVEAVAAREEWVRLDAPAEYTDEDESQFPGEFVKAPQCPKCARFMRTWYEPDTGMPIATCQRDGCDGALDARALIDRGVYEE